MGFFSSFWFCFALSYPILLCCLLLKQDSSVLPKLVSDCWVLAIKDICNRQSCKSLWPALIKSSPLTPNKTSVGGSEELWAENLDGISKSHREKYFLRNAAGVILLFFGGESVKVPNCVCVGPSGMGGSRTSQNFQFLPYHINTVFIHFLRGMNLRAEKCLKSMIWQENLCMLYQRAAKEFFNMSLVRGKYFQIVIMEGDFFFTITAKPSHCLLWSGDHFLWKTEQLKTQCRKSGMAHLWLDFPKKSIRGNSAFQITMLSYIW